MSVKLKFNSKLRRTIGELFFFCISTTLTLKDDRIKLTYHNKSKSEKESSQKKNSHNKSVQYIWQPKKKKSSSSLLTQSQHYGYIHNMR